MRIEEFTEKDEGPVVALWERCGLLRPWNDPHEDIARKLHIQRDLFLVGKLGEEVVATVMGGYEGHRGWVNYLAVDPERQHQGLGRAMMEEIERRLEALGAPKINLQIRDDNLAAAAFYERIGFARDKVISMGKRL